MLLDVTHESRVLCSKLCSAGGVMLNFCQLKWHFHPPPPFNKHSWSFIFERMLRNNYSLKHLISKWKMTIRNNCEALKVLLVYFVNEPAFNEQKTNSIKNALGLSLGYQVPKNNIPTLINFEHSWASCWQKQHYVAKILVLCQHYAWCSRYTCSISMCNQMVTSEIRE